MASPSLPSPLTSFVGRVAERTALADVLIGHRLVTAVGPGGVGKTRLAVAVAADITSRYANGAWYVDLVAVTDPSMVGAAVASAFGFGEQLGRSPSDTVIAKLAGAEALVVLDNCEHLVDGVTAFVERLLSGCPRTTVLATSRARLQVPFEWVFPVPGLSLDDDGGEGDAVALFVERAAMAGWSSPHPGDRRRIAAICERARRDRPGDRAGGGAAGDLRTRRPGGGPGRPVGSAGRWASARRPAPVGPVRPGLELRPPRREGPGGAAAGVGVRGTVHVRGGGHGHRTCAADARAGGGRAGPPRRPQPAGGGRRSRPDPLPDAGDDPAVRRGADGRGRRGHRGARAPPALVPDDRGPAGGRRRHRRGLRRGRRRPAGRTRLGRRPAGPAGRRPRAGRAPGRADLRPGDAGRGPTAVRGGGRAGRRPRRSGPGPSPRSGRGLGPGGGQRGGTALPRRRRRGSPGR